MIIDEVEREDPVNVPLKEEASKESFVWCGASNLALGVVLEIEDNLVEDGSWLRKSVDNCNIISESEAVVKGINFLLNWGIKELEKKSDSKTVLRWIRNGINMNSRIYSKVISEMPVKEKKKKKEKEK